MNDIEASAERVMLRCDELATHSEEPDCLTRRFATPPMRLVNERVLAWMREAGMAVHQDAIGNVIGRYEGASAPASHTLLLGSHLDSVRDAGKYDGPLGVLVALECVARLHARGERLPFAIEVYGFADEEGLRFHSAYLGSRAIAGSLGSEALALVDGDGISLAGALRQFGGSPEALSSCQRRTDDLLGYCEVHIEQGPVLEHMHLPVGVVTAIQGQTRIEVTYNGVAGHAGTVPPALRRDALCAASEFILAVEGFASSQSQLVATVGQIEAHPGASNVIPGKVTLSLDVRHPDDAMREAACANLEEEARAIAARRGVRTGWRVLQATASVPCEPDLAGTLARAIAAHGVEVARLASGAGHDAAIMSQLTGVSMLFVRCAGGVSHSPAESVTAADVGTAIATLERFLGLLAGERQPT